MYGSFLTTYQPMHIFDDIYDAVRYYGSVNEWTVECGNIITNKQSLLLLGLVKNLIPNPLKAVKTRKAHA